VCSLDPLPLTAINAMYDAECMIGIVSELVLDTLQCIAEDVSKLERKKSELENIKKKDTKLEQGSIDAMLVVSRSRAVRSETDHVNVICEGPRCARIVDGEPVYTKICCKDCDGRFMYFCKSMTWRGVCKRCGCAQSKHRWATTESKIVTDTVQLRQEKGRQAANAESQSKVKAISTVISVYEEELMMYEDEAEKMLSICAKLNTYVNQKALVVRSPDADEFNKTLMDRIEAYGSTKSKRLDNLQQIQKDYNMYLEMEENNSYEPSNVNELIEQLCALPKRGNDLKEAIEVEQRARRKVAVEKQKAGNWKVLAGFFGQLKLKIKQVGKT